MSLGLFSRPRHDSWVDKEGTPSQPTWQEELRPRHSLPQLLACLCLIPWKLWQPGLLCGCTNSLMPKPAAPPGWLSTLLSPEHPDFSKHQNPSEATFWASGLAAVTWLLGLGRQFVPLSANLPPTYPTRVDLGWIWVLDLRTELKVWYVATPQTHTRDKGG